MTLRSYRDMKNDPDRFRGDIRSLKSVRAPHVVHINGLDLDNTWTEYPSGGQALRIKFFQNTVQSGLMLAINRPTGEGIEVYDGMLIEANIERFYLRFRDTNTRNSTPILVYLAEFPELIVDNYPINSYWLYLNSNIADGVSWTNIIYPVGGRVDFIIMDASGVAHNWDFYINKYSYSSVVARQWTLQNEISGFNAHPSAMGSFFTEGRERVLFSLTNRVGAARDAYLHIKVSRP